MGNKIETQIRYFVFSDLHLNKIFVQGPITKINCEGFKVYLIKVSTSVLGEEVTLSKI